MLNDYLGDVRRGRLAGARFILLWILLAILFVVVGIAIGASLGFAENIIGGNLSDAQAKLRKLFSLPAIIILVTFALLFFFAQLNIIAKRARDAGLPGWITALVIAIAMGATGQNVDSLSGGGLGFLLAIVLALIPTNSFGNKS